MLLSYSDCAEHLDPGKVRISFFAPGNAELDWDSAWLLGTLVILSSW